MSATAMLIRCKLKRPGGTPVDVLGDGRLVKFSPDENDDHVAMVTDPRQIERLLSITEAYSIHTGPAAATAVVEAAGTTSKPVPVPEPVIPAAEPVAQLIETEPDQTHAPAPPAASLDEMGDDDLRAVFLAEVKRTPHHNAKRETLISQIEATREEANK